ncbi:MAG: carbohydrate ABC transporter permease [Opitutales bacterium]|nr:carbohydrate ABC transporter permease [Opitutales bacterium]
MNNTSKFNRRLVEFLVIAVSVIFVAPIILVFLTSFKPDAEIIRFQGIMPIEWTLGNFREILGAPEEIPIFRWLFNSFLISFSVTFLVLTVSSLAAYGLARLNLPGGRILFFLIIATLMVPPQILLVPVYLILNTLGWLDTPLALIIPAGAGAFGVFLLHQFFKGIPKDLEEAAAIDGCSKLGIYWHVILPLSKPALATLGIFTFIGSWNDFMGPLIFLDSVEKYTLPVGIALFQTSYYAEYGLTLAASVICTLPVIVVFLFFHKYIIRGIAMSGLKE